MSYEQAETDRRLGNLVRIGTVAQLNAAQALVTVDLGDLVTDWLPWIAARAGGNRHWAAPEPGEQVLVLSPSGELAQGIVLPAIYQDAFPANAASADIERTTYGDGSTVEYNRAAHRLTVNVGAGTVVVNCSQATVNGNVQVNGSVNVTGDVVAGGISLINHTHPGVSRGGARTDPP
jgi:phage baseplate assembly protein V